MHAWLVIDSLAGIVRGSRSMVRVRVHVLRSFSPPPTHNPSFVSHAHLRSLLRALLCAADFVSVQAMLFNGAARNWWQQMRVLVRYQSRMLE